MRDVTRSALWVTQRNQRYHQVALRLRLGSDRILQCHQDQAFPTFYLLLNNTIVVTFGQPKSLARQRLRKLFVAQCLLKRNVGQSRH